jgi:hypothetical protein
VFGLGPVIEAGIEAAGGRVGAAGTAVASTLGG